MTEAERIEYAATTTDVDDSTTLATYLERFMQAYLEGEVNGD